MLFLVSTYADNSDREVLIIGWLIILIKRITTLVASSPLQIGMSSIRWSIDTRGKLMHVIYVYTFYFTEYFYVIFFYFCKNSDMLMIFVYKYDDYLRWGGH